MPANEKQYCSKGESIMIIPLFPEGKEKCLTLSYDDGVTQDRRFIALLNQYHLKATFNLNSGCFGKSALANGFSKPVTHNKINASEVKSLYSGHEVAVHTRTHPHLEYLSSESIAYEIRTDRENLENLVNYPVTGMAYPFGTYNKLVLEEVKKAGIQYSRTVQSTKTFALPQDFLCWHPTCHFGEDGMESLLQRFLYSSQENCEQSILKVFYLWGHSYELDGNDTWEKMEDFCQKVSHQKDIWYATNIEIVEYQSALKRLIFSENKQIIKNPSALPVWLMIDHKIIKINGGETIFSTNRI